MGRGVAFRRAAPAVAAVAALWLFGAGCAGTDADLPCHFTAEDDGTRRMECPDGTSAVFPPPVTAPRTGSVSGSASLFGEPRRDGIDVWLSLAPSDPEAAPPSLHAVTDAEGRFRFDDVPPGVHRVSVRATGFRGVDREVVVDPGEFVLPPVVLRRGVEALSGANLDLHLSPRGDSFVVRYGQGADRRLAYWEPGGAGMVPLGQKTRTPPPYFDAAGAYIHFLEKTDEPEQRGYALMRYEVDAGRLLAVAEEVTSFWPSPDGQSIVLEGVDRELRTWNRRHGPDGAGDRTVTSRPLSWAAGPGYRLLAVQTSNGALVVWDLEELTGDVLGPWGGEPTFSPDGRGLVANLGNGLVAWDAATSRAVHLGPGSDVTFHDSGRRFAYLATEGATRRLVHVDLDRGAAPETVRERVATASYGPGDGGLAWTEEVEGGVELFVAPGPGSAPTSLGRGAAVGDLLWSRDGRRLFFTVFDGEEWVGRLDVYEPGLGVHTLALDVLGAPALEPEGDGLLFLVGSGGTAALDYWDPVTDEVIRILDDVDPAMADEFRSGPGSRLLVVSRDWRFWRWDPATRTSLLLGAGSEGTSGGASFLADGAVLFVDSLHRLGLLDADATEARVVGAGVGDVITTPGLAERFSYRHALTGPYPWLPSGPGTLVLFDRAANRAIPLDDDVYRGIQGRSFVAYVRKGELDGDAERLFLVTYPVGER